MRTRIRELLPCAALLFAGLALADDAGDRSRLIGTWQPAEQSGAVWILQGDDRGLHLTRMQSDQKVADFECNTVGRECDIKGARGLKVSMWYSGPKLVVMETRGTDVVKYRLHAIDDSKLEIEVIPIVPAGKPETVGLTRRVRPPGTSQ